jgi:putative tricarboxylic transport membrane protein
MKKSATASSALFFGFAIGALIVSMKLPLGTLNAPAAGFFPAVLAALLALTSLLSFINALRSGHERADPAEPLRWKKIVFTVSSLLVYAFVFESFGYLVATFLFIIFLLRIVEQKTWGLAVAVAFVAAFFSYLIFGLLLGTPLPAGLLPI